jgi:hypothetical protein
LTITSLAKLQRTLLKHSVSVTMTQRQGDLHQKYPVAEVVLDIYVV